MKTDVFVVFHSLLHSSKRKIGRDRANKIFDFHDDSTK